MFNDGVTEYKIILFLFDWIMTLYASAFILRGIFSIVHADFYNPLSQAIFKITEPLMSPVRRLIPEFNRFDPACWFFAWLFNGLKMTVIVKMAGMSLPLTALVFFSFLEVFELLLQIYVMSIFILAISSWFMSGLQLQTHSLISLLSSITSPILVPLRRFIPAVGTFDFTPLAALFILYWLSNFIHSLKFI